MNPSQPPRLREVLTSGSLSTLPSEIFPPLDVHSIVCVPLICSMFWEFVLDILGIPDKEPLRATDGQTAELGRGSDLALRRNFQAVSKDTSTRGRPGRGGELQQGGVSS